MLHLNEVIIREYGRFSLKGIQAKFTLPEAYLASTLQDFLESRATVRPTEWCLFDPGYWNFSLIIIPACHYRQTKETEEPEKALAEAEADYVIRALKSDDRGPYDREEVEKEALQKVKNAELYDLMGKFPINSKDDIPSGTKLYNVALGYYLPYDFAALWGYQLHGPARAARIPDTSELSDLVSLRPAFV